MEKIRKAVVAGVGAAVTAGMAVIVEAWAGGITADEGSKALGAAIAAAALVGWTTWRVPNAT
jgi:hypothetical protein